MKTILVPLAEGFEEMEAITIIDVLRRADLEVITFSLSEDYCIRGSHGIVVKADALSDSIDISSADMMVLPGGMPGSANLNNHAGLRQMIKTMNESGKLIGAICAAPFVLGELGLLKGKTATCYPGFEERLMNANVVEQGVVANENIVTGKGAGWAMAFSLRLVEILVGKTKAEEIGKKLLFNEVYSDFE